MLFASIAYGHTGTRTLNIDIIIQSILDYQKQEQ